MKKTKKLIFALDNKIIKITIEEQIKEQKEFLKKLKQQFSCDHKWKFMDSYFAEDCHWLCVKCKYKFYIM